MSYQVLARKWRPRSFSSLVGQEHVVRALTHALTEKRLHHAYLFTGTRGVGKTTIARILAKSLNCESGITAEPCGVCSACQEIDSGRFVDLLEVDAATNTRVDEMRQLLENAVYAPTRGRFKVYVIDEVHMLSNSAFNAMLKTLEEPPEHVKFILATTDPQKIPVTVLSRCLQFNLKQMPPQAIIGHLNRILESEKIFCESPALALLARSANGSMRDALSLLDQAIAHGTGRVEEAQVRDMLGTVDQDYLYSILDAMVSGDVTSLLRVADDMALRSLSFESALQDLAGLLTRLQVAQLAPQAIADDFPDKLRLIELAARFSPEAVQLAYQISVHGREELPLAPDAYSGFLMTLLRLYAFRPEVAEVEAGKKPSVVGVFNTSTTPTPAQRPAATVAAAAPEQGQSASPVSGRREKSLEWYAILPSLQLSGMARELAQHCEMRGYVDGQVILRLPPGHRHLLMRAGQDKLQQALSEYFETPIQLKIEVAEVQSVTPAANMQRERQERQERAVEAIERDGFVRDVIEMFDATLIEASIKPI